MLRKVLDLVDEDVDGKLADVRTFNADGSLRYTHVKEEPQITRLKRVEIKEKNGVKWLYWYWESIPQTMCDYSGVALTRDDVEEYHIDLLG